MAVVIDCTHKCGNRGATDGTGFKMIRSTAFRNYFECNKCGRTTSYSWVTGARLPEGPPPPSPSVPARSEVPKSCPRCSGALGAGDKFCRNCGHDVSDPADAELLISKLADRVSHIEAKLASSRAYDVNFWPRAWALWGHVMVIQVIVAVCVWVVVWLLFNA